MSVRLVPPGVDAVPVDVPDDQVEGAIARGWKPLAGAGAAAFETTPAPDTSLGAQANAAIGEGLSTATLGGSDFVIGQLGTQAEREYHEKVRRDNPGAALVGGAIGAIADPFGATTLAGKIGARAAKGLEEGGAIAQLAGAGVRAGTEGAVFGAGTGVSELSLSADPVTIEHAASVIGSNMLFGGVAGAGVGVAGKGLELGLRRAKVALDQYAEKGIVDAGTNVGDDLASLDRKGLRAAEKTELEAIEAARVPKRAELADEIKAFRQELKANKPWLATKDAEEAEIRAIGARTRKADRALDNVLDDPKALAESPKAALKQLRVQEAALDDLVTKHADTLRAKFAGDTSGARAAALDYASVALEKNRALQAKITEVSGPKASARLDAISDAVAGLSAAKQPAGSTIGEALGASALGHAVGALAGVPYLGQAVLAAKAVGGVWKKLGGNTAAAAERASKAVQTFLDVGAKVAPKAPVVASKVLASVAYGSSKPKKEASLADSYHARAGEIRALTALGPDGKPMMRMDERAKMSARLAAIKATNPLLADKIESTKARGVEFLASKLPRKPDLPGIGMGPDSWQPPDMEMRGFARYVAAVEDPHGVVERLASGQVTPEDAEAMRTVYPKMYADIQQQIMGQLGELQAKLPYQRRLALSIFSGVPVDPAMDPNVLAMLQGGFALEEGSDGGTQAPVAQAQFGSVSKESPTPAQERGA